ncbi:MAG TPA: 2-isopropylmalate synthase [Polyangiales bacterium]|jgi:2-isopropylmalate synthase|nr:2-isopropylmalate synthase [Polyangiales bacterium]
MTTDNHVRIFDTTLRDGEQSPGATMTLEEKLRIARNLEALGVDIIEAGFPAASAGELQSVREIAAVLDDTEVAGLCRTRDPDIEAAWKAVSGAKKPRLHVFIATSKLHMEHKLKLSPQQVLEEVRRGVKHCASLTKSVEFSAEDATRTDLEFLKEVFACAVENGATTLNIPDTVGYTMPTEYTRIVKEIMTHVVGDKPIVVSTHCHNDLGLAVANSIAAIMAGARQVECCVNGIGERAGNAALEELVMALRVRKDLVGCDTRINAREIMNVSRLVSQLTGLSIAANKPIVGRNAFAHEAGIHQHGMLKDRRTYEIMRPEDIGVTESKMVLGKHSGRHALHSRLTELGYRLSQAQLDQVFDRFKNLADRKKNIYDEDLTALVADDVFNVPNRYELVSLETRSGTGLDPWAKATVRVDGKTLTREATGNGPVNALVQALKECTGNTEVQMDEYHIDALSTGSDAQGKVSIGISADGITSRGQATDIDVVIASGKAFIAALNHRAYQLELTRLQAVANA